MTDAKKPEEKKQPEPVLNIFQALPRITGEIAPISKDRQGVGVPYKFRGIDDVYAALNLLLAKHGVSVLPEILESKHEEVGKSAKGATMYRHTQLVRFHLVAADGSRVTADAEGEGIDNSDKATPKCASTAYKSMAFQVFCIPTGEKIDSEEESPEVQAKPAVKTNGKAPKAEVSAEEQLAARLIEECEAGFAAQKDRDDWHAAHKPQVDAMDPTFRKSVAEAFRKAVVRS